MYFLFIFPHLPVVVMATAGCRNHYKQGTYRNTTGKYFQLNIEEKKGMKKKLLIAAFCVIAIAAVGSGSKNSSNAATKKQQVSSNSIENEVLDADDKKECKSGDYTIDGIDFSFTDHVRNDATGNWRISLIADSKADVFQYCVDYYKEMFTSDNEIHAIVNFSLNTTSKISVLSDGVLDVCIYDYVKGEEHYAEKLFGGELLKEEFISVETGEPVEY